MSFNVVDSSGWIEFLTRGPNAATFRAPISAEATLIVPTISIYEVFKRSLLLHGEAVALLAGALMLQGRVVDLDHELSTAAARLSLAHKLPMADSIILATARRFGATLWTQDADFEGIEGVRYSAREG